MILCLSVCIFFGKGSAEIVDRIIAVVQNDVITLTDLRITEAFVLYEEDRIDPEQDLHSQVLDILINRKLVVLMTREDVLVEEEDIDIELQRITEKLGGQKIQANLEDFGLTIEDLRGLLKETLSYRRVLSRRFNKTIIVSLREIEQYYYQRYIPSLKGAEESARPMMEILDQLEAAVKQEKIEDQIATWLNYLRREAYVEIKTDEGART
jgi:peptidyl-prolyl cis-trans isomerase SurA